MSNAPASSIVVYSSPNTDPSAEPSRSDLADVSQESRADDACKLGNNSLLTPRELRTLARAERTINEGLHSFYKVGEALKKVRDRKLYRAEHATFEEYLKRRWGFSKPVGYRYIDAADVHENLSPIGDKFPDALSQVRPLAPLTPDQRRTVWTEMMGQPKRITAKLIQQAADRLCSKRVDDSDASVQAFAPISDFACADLEAARGSLEPKSVKLVIVNQSLADAGDTLRHLGRFLHDDCILVVICTSKQERDASASINEGGFTLVDDANYYASVTTDRRVLGRVNRHRRVLVATRNGVARAGGFTGRLPDPIVCSPDKPDALPIGMMHILIDGLTAAGDLVVIPADRYGAGVIAARRLGRSVLGLDDPEHYAEGRARIDKVIYAPRRIDAELDALRLPIATPASEIELEQSTPRAVAEPAVVTAPGPETGGAVVENTGGVK